MAEDEKTIEQPIAPEIPRTGWETLIIFQRHGRYDSNRPAVWGEPTEEEQKTLGRLTPEGKIEAAKRADERIDAALAQDPEHTDFLLINSPTFWLDDEKLGQRARETAEIISDEIRKNLQDRGISENHLLNLSTNKYGEAAFTGGVSRPEKRVGEALMFQVPEFANFLRQEYKGQGPDFWRAFYNDVHKELREEKGAEGPVEIANKSNEVINIVARFADFYHKKHPHRKLVAWVVGHGDSVRPYVQRVLGVPYEDFAEGYNDGVGIGIDKQGNGKAVVSGKEYRVPLVKHGKPTPITG